MATTSSTRPPTSGEVSRAPEGEELHDIPLVGSEHTHPVAPVGEEGAEPTEAVASAPGRFDTEPSLESLPPVLALVEQAHGSEGVVRAQLAGLINRGLEKMVSEGGSRRVADGFHQLIESGRLEGLADTEGRSCHEMAVRGLLALGYPYALEVRPEDLERLSPLESRGWSRWRGKPVKGAAAGVLVGGSLAEIVLHLVSEQPITGLLTAEVGVALLAAMALLFSGPRTPLRHLGLAVLVAVSVLSVFLAVLGGYAGLVPGLAGLVAALLFALHRS